jgi:hypothetical protein
MSLCAAIEHGVEADGLLELEPRPEAFTVIVREA